MSLFEWIQKPLGFLYNLFLNIVIVLFYGEGRETRHIHQGIGKERSGNNVQCRRGTLHPGEVEDTVDFSLTSNLTKSLEKVSEAIYRKFILDWHSPPETLQNQPLYKEINSGLQSVFFNIKSRVLPLEEYEIIISVATGLIAHFQNKKKKKQTVNYRFTRRQEEVDFLRQHTARLLDYWLPDSMKSSQLLYVFLTEILSVNVLEQSINNFSKPTFINEAIVLLNDNPATQQKKVSGTCDKKNQGIRSSAQNESDIVMESDIIICSSRCDNQSDTSTGAEAAGTIKKEKKGILKKVRGLFKRDKSKTTKSKQAISFRSLNFDSDAKDGGSDDGNEYSNDGREGSDDDNEDNNDDTEGSDDGSDDGSEGSDDDNEDSNDGKEGSDEEDDRENGIKSTLSIINTTLQKWQQNHWTAKVSESSVEKEDEYVISVYAESAPGAVLWNTKRRAEDFKLIYEKICQKYTDFPKFPKSDAIGGSISDDDGPFFHSIGTTPDKFIKFFFQKLLDLIKIQQDTEAMFFFSPFDYEDDVKGIRKGLPCSEEEHLSEQTTTDDESSGDSSNSRKDPHYPKIAFRSLYDENDEEQSYEAADKKSSNLLDTSEQENKSKNNGESSKFNKSDPKDCYQPDGVWQRFKRKHKKSKLNSRNKQEDKPSTRTHTAEPPNNVDFTRLKPQNPGQRGLDVIDQNITQTMEQQKQKLQKDVLIVIYQLVDEVLSGGVVSFLHSIGAMKSYNKYILNHIPDMYAEEQIIWCLNGVADLLMSEFRPQELTPSELQAKALEVLKNKVQGFVTNFLVKFVLNEKNLKATHQALQDQLANKETLYLGARNIAPLLPLITTSYLPGVCNIFLQWRPCHLRPHSIISTPQGLLEDLTKIITNDHH
ncbi:uncharacterized protein [Dendrobates tinctorius]|uniref:uncharacterized protein isoform X2 n=1 Tax=Dendrobates tinctorius TaxID=92724 RepID=UPI003CC94883